MFFQWKGMMARVRGLLLFSVATLFIVFQLTNWPMETLLTILTILTFFISVIHMSPLPRVMSILSVAFGHIIFFLYQGEYNEWQRAVTDNLGMIALFVSAPLLAYPLKSGGYVEYMYHFVKNHLRRSLPQIAFVTTLTCVLSSFLNLGAARIVYELFADYVKKTERIFAKAITQGFSLAAFWSPYFAGVVIILSLLNISFIQFLPYGISILVIGLIVSIFLTFRDFSRDHPEKQIAATVVKKACQKSPLQRLSENRKGFELILIFIGLFVLLFLLEKRVELNLILLISIIAFFYSILWALSIQKKKDYVHAIKHDYIPSVLPNVHNESIMFIAGAFFAQMVQLTPFPVWLSSQLMKISQVSVIFTVLSIIVPIVILSFFIHQILPITILAANIQPEVIGLTPELFAMALIISWGMSPMLSPINAMNIITTNILHLKAFQLGRWNFKYASIIIGCLSLFITLLSTLLKL